MKLSPLAEIQATIAACRVCPKMVGAPVYGPPVESSLFLLGQAPGPHEESLGRPFAYTAGKTLFSWFREVCGVPEARFRANVYMAAVARCYPGKGKGGGGDRVPDAEEILRCGSHLQAELEILRPRLILAVGKLAISQVLGREKFGTTAKLTSVVGRKMESTYHGVRADVICLPHPSGLSSWHKTEPGKSLLREALFLVRDHPAWKAQFKLGSFIPGTRHELS